MISQGGHVVWASRATAGSQPERSVTSSWEGFTRTLSSALRLVEPLAHVGKGKRKKREGREGEESGGEERGGGESGTEGKGRRI